MSMLEPFPPQIERWLERWERGNPDALPAGWAQPELTDEECDVAYRAALEADDVTQPKVRSKNENSQARKALDD